MAKGANPGASRELATALRTLLELSGLTRRQVAARSDLEERRVGDWLRGDHVPGEEPLRRLLRALIHAATTSARSPFPTEYAHLLNDGQAGPWWKWREAARPRILENANEDDDQSQSMPFAIELNRIRGSHQSDAENFVELCNVLVAEEYSHVKIFPSARDSGDPDCLIAESPGLFHAFQHHYCPGRRLDENQERQICEDLADTFLKYDLSRLTLCVPVYMLPNEQRRLRKELLARMRILLAQRIEAGSSASIRRKMELADRIEIDLWHQPKVLARILKYPRIATRFFGTSPLDTLSSPARLIIDWRGARWDYHNNGVFITFALANIGGGIARVERIALEVLDSYPCPEYESPWQGAVMQEFRFDIDLSPELDLYPIGDGTTFVYKHGDIDGFKIKLCSAAGYYYRLVLKVGWYDVERKVARATQVEPFLARFPRVT